MTSLEKLLALGEGLMPYHGIGPDKGGCWEVVS